MVQLQHLYNVVLEGLLQLTIKILELIYSKGNFIDFKVFEVSTGRSY